MSLLVPREKKKPPKPVQFRPPPELVAEIDAVRRPLNLSRNEAMTKLLRMGLDEHKKELAKRRGAKDH